MLEFIKQNYQYLDGNLYRTKNICGQKIGSIAGWVTNCNGRQYRKMSINKKIVYVHHAIFLLHHGYLPSYIDHIDGNPLNNRIENLRSATQSQNMGNSKLKKNNSSGYKGVTFRKDTKKWNASIMVNGKHISLGCYKTKEEARDAYIIGSKKYFGEFSRV